MSTSRPSNNCALGRRSIWEIQRKIDKLTRENELVKYFTASNGKGKIAGWRLELNGILQVFNVCSMCPTLSLLTICSLDQIGSEHAHHNIQHSMNGQAGQIRFLLNRFSPNTNDHQ